MESAVNYLVTIVQSCISPDYIPKEIIEQAKKMESKEKRKHQLFIGKVSEIIGFDKTVELLKECK